MQSRALIDFGELSLNRAMRVYGAVGDLSVRNGLFYPSKAPLLSFAAAPIYAVLRSLAGGTIGSVPEIPLVFFARLFLTALPTLLLLGLLRRFLEAYVDETITDLFVTFYALGTLAFSYSLQFLSHQTSAALLFAGFYAGWRWSRSEAPEAVLLLVGLLSGLGVTAEYTSAMPAGLVAVWIAFARPGTLRDRVLRLAVVAAGALVPLALLGAYHSRCFGSPLETGYKHLADAAYQPWHLGGFLGIRTPDPRAFALSLFSPLRGLLALSPGLFLGVLGLRDLWKDRVNRPELGTVAILTGTLLLGYLYFTSSFSYESWGWTTGPRHMTGLVPFLLLPSAVLYSRLTSASALGIARGLLAASIVVTAVMTMVNYIPDDVSEAVFGLVIPLGSRGYLVPSLLNFAGLINPWAGLAFPILILAIAGWVLLYAAPKRSLAPALLTVLAVLGLHRVAYRDTAGDRGARDLLVRVWLAPPGVAPRFWSTRGSP